MLEHIPSFYCLHYLSAQPWSKQGEARRELLRLSSHMALAFRDYLFMACIGESRHGIKQMGAGFDGFGYRSRNSVFQESLQYAPSQENLQRLVDLFNLPDWPSSFGGAKWAAIAQKVARYGVLNDVLFVDMIVNSQHNGGLAFNKTEASLYLNFSFNFAGSLKSYLDYRRAAADPLRDTAKYAKAYGLTTGRLVLDYLDETGGLSSFREKAQSIPDGCYQPAAWSDADLPPLIEREMPRCKQCGHIVGETYTCPECDGVFCEDCWSMSDNGLCESCAEGQGEDCHDCGCSGANIWCPKCHEYFCDNCWSKGNLGMCLDCYRERYQSLCPECDEYHDSDLMHACDNCGYLYCNDCWDGDDKLCHSCQEEQDEAEEPTEEQDEEVQIQKEQDDDSKYHQLINDYLHA